MRTRTRKHPQSVNDRLRPIAAHVDSFRLWLCDRGYRPATITEIMRLLACWTAWLQAAGFGLSEIAAGFDASKAVFTGCKTIRAPLGAGTLFIEHLRAIGTLPVPPEHPSPTDIWPILAGYRTWMTAQRGVTKSTLDNYQDTLVALLRILGDDPGSYTALAVRGFVLDRARLHGRERARSTAVATRSFLRFLVAMGHCPVGRDDAVPSFTTWPLASTPRFIGADDVSRVIAACAGEDRLRDRAVILLLARLGLRASEVANLEFARIDWQSGRIAVSGKTRREEWLPLTQEIGDAIIAYLEKARPRSATPRLFITDTAPLQPLTRIAVKCIVRRALTRAGVASRHQGAHVLRHSAATAMLRHGVSLDGVSAVLRHRSPAMTMHYAKIDFALLSEIVQPWTGRLPC